jgi:hypothetical protein
MVSVIVAALTFVGAAAAWGGLAWLIMFVPPSRPLALLVAYVFAFTAVTTTVALITWAVFRPRDAEGQLATPARYLAHAMVFAFLLVFAFWLQGMRSLTPIVAALLIGLYAVLELAILFGTRGSVELPVRR